MLTEIPTSLNARGRRSPGNGGFTLVELIVVITVVGIVSAVCVTSLTSLGSTRDAAAARQLLHDMSYAREVALMTGTRTWVKFNLQAGAYSLFSENITTPGREHATALPDPATGFEYVQILGVGEFPGVTITAASFDGGTEIGFDWMGAPLNVNETALAIRGAVTLTGGHGIVIEPETGNIELAASP